MNIVRVSDIHGCTVRAEAEPFRPLQPIRHWANVPGFGIIPIDLTWQLRLVPEALLEAVDWVGEPDCPVWRVHNIVDRVEPASVERAQDRPCLKRRVAAHQRQPSGLLFGALCAEEDAVFGGAGDAAVGHDYIAAGNKLQVPCLWVASAAEESVDEDCRAVPAVVEHLVAGHEERVLVFFCEERARFVEDRGRCFQCDVDGWVGPEKTVAFVLVDKELEVGFFWSRSAGQVVVLGDYL